MDSSQVIGMCGVALAVISLGYTIITKKNSKIDNIDDRLIKIETRFEFIWALVEKKAVEILHHPDTPDFDYLIFNYEKKKLNKDELIEFIRQLDAKTLNSNISAGEKAFATLMLGAIWSKYADKDKDIKDTLIGLIE